MAEAGAQKSGIDAAGKRNGGAGAATAPAASQPLRIPQGSGQGENAGGSAAKAAGGAVANKAMSEAGEELGGIDPQQLQNAAGAAAQGDLAGAAKEIKKGFMQWVVREGFWYIAALDISIIFIPLVVLALDIIWAFGKWQKVELTTIQKIVLAGLNALVILVLILAFVLALLLVCNSTLGAAERIYAAVVGFFGSSYTSICKPLQPI